MIRQEPEVFCDLPQRFSPCEYRVKWATSGWEINQARRLRRDVFCLEQGVFEGDDRDSIDEIAQTLVAVSCVAGMADQVFGTVRIHSGDEGIWWGSRLAVDTQYRRDREMGGRLGASLIRLAVSSAHARGAQIFLAHVQAQHQGLFEKLHWRTLKAEHLHNRPHWLMQADLATYPPCHDPITGFVTRTPPPRLA